MRPDIYRLIVAFEQTTTDAFAGVMIDSVAFQDEAVVQFMFCSIFNRADIGLPYISRQFLVIVMCSLINLKCGYF